MLNVVNFTSPSGGSFPQQQTITDANGPGLPPVAIIVVLSGNSTAGSLDTPQATGRISVGISDFTTTVSCAGVMQDNVSAGSANTGYRVDNNAIVTMPSDGGAGALDVEATLVSRTTNEIVVEWSATSAFRGYVVFIYGQGATAAAETLTGSASIGGTATSTALGSRPDLVIGCSVGQAFDSGSGGNEYMLSFGMIARHSASQACISACAESLQSPTSSGSIARDDAIVTQLTSAAGVVTEGARLEAALTSTGFTLTTRNAAVALAGMYLSLNLRGARCWTGIETIAAGTTGNKAITTPGFRPRTVGSVGARLTSVNTVSSVQNPVSIGWANSLVSGLAGLWGRDGQTTSETDSVASQANLLDVLAGTATHDWVASYVGPTATGFDINVSDAAGADRMSLFWAVERQGDAASLPNRHSLWRRQLARM